MDNDSPIAVIEDLEQLVELNPTDVEINASEDHVLSSDDNPYTLSLRIDTFEEDKDLDKFVKACARLIRTCPEYKYWVEYIRDTLGYRKCDITGENMVKATVDIHHHPYSLFTIVKAVILKNLESGKSVCTADIMIEVLQLHFEMKVPFCLLMTSLHEMFERGHLQIPMELIHGDYNYFLTHLLKYLSDEEADSITGKLAINRENCGWRLKWITNLSAQEE